jgi:hypothetical protein
MVVSHHQNAGQIYNLLTANEYSQNVEKFKYLGTSVTDRPTDRPNQTKGEDFTFDNLQGQTDSMINHYLQWIGKTS